MPAFNYTAYDGAGKIRKGRLDAPSSLRAAELLADRGLVAVDIREAAARNGGRKKPFTLSYHGLFCRGLSAYLKRGVPLAEALKFLSRHSSNKRVAGACLHLHEGVLGGVRLSSALEETGLFREDLLRIVESGEKTSALPAVLEQAAALYAMQDGMRRKIRSALAYPLAMTAVGAAVVAFLLTYVVPRLAGLFADMGQALPLPTRILLGLSAFLSDWGIPLLVFLAAIIYWAGRRGKTFKLPFFRAIGENLALSLVMTHLRTLLASGIPLVQALPMAASMDGRYGERWTEAARLVKEGHRFDRALERLGAVSEETVYILRIGELAGDLPGAIDQVAEMNWEEARDRMERAATLAEPLLVLCLGAAVGFVVIAILLPIFDLSGLVG